MKRKGEEVGHELQEADLLIVSRVSPPTAGLPGAEVRRRSFPLGHELPGQVLGRGAHQKVQPAAAGSRLHVPRVQIERNPSTDRGEALHLHR